MVFRLFSPLGVALAFFLLAAAFFLLAAVPSQRPATWYKEAAAGNGANATYTLSHTPESNVEAAVFLNGLYETEGYDYSLSGRVVVFSQPPGAGDAVRFWYLGR